MSDELKFPGPSTRDAADRDSLSDPVKRLIREAYMPPVSTADSVAYWGGMEQRIMSGIESGDFGAADGVWWSALSGWGQVGLIAAAAIFAVTGIVNDRLAESESEFAYESVVQPATPADLSARTDLISAPEGISDSDGAFGYVLSQ